MNPFQSSSIFVLVLFLCFISTKQSHSLSRNCEKVDSCTCRLDNNGGLINLHFASYSKNGKPVFHYQSSRPPAYFTYSPCAGIPCGMSVLDKASVCMDPTILTPAEALGTEKSASFEVGEDGGVTLLYSAFPAHLPAVSSRVRLKCSKMEQLVLDANSTVAYNFTLSSPCACPDACRGPLHPGHGLEMSVGTILVLIFFSVVVIYFGIGCLYRRAVYGTNCSESVPHREFWASIPPLIKDGYMFFISPCLGNRTEYKTYDKL